MELYSELSRRERQIIDILFSLGEATAQDIQAKMDAAPSYSTVRALLNILEEKGHIQHTKTGRQYLYKPVVQKTEARSSAMSHMLSTFFDGSAVEAVASLLDTKRQKISKAELERLSEIIKQAAEEEE
jgi:BlaI family penicillinase repressor